MERERETGVAGDAMRGDALRCDEGAAGVGSGRTRSGRLVHVWQEAFELLSFPT